MAEHSDNKSFIPDRIAVSSVQLREEDNERRKREQAAKDFQKKLKEDAEEKLNKQITTAGGMSPTEMIKWLAEKTPEEQLELLGQAEKLLSQKGANPIVNALTKQALNMIHHWLAESQKVAEQSATAFAKLEIPIQTKMLQLALNVYDRLTDEAKRSVAQAFQVIFPTLDEKTKKTLASNLTALPDFQALPDTIKKEIEKNIRAEEEERNEATKKDVEKAAENIQANQQQELEAATAGATTAAAAAEQGGTLEEIGALTTAAQSYVISGRGTASDVSNIIIDTLAEQAAQATGVVTTATGEEEYDDSETFDPYFNGDTAPSPSPKPSVP